MRGPEFEIVETEPDTEPAKRSARVRRAALLIALAVVATGLWAGQAKYYGYVPLRTVMGDVWLGGSAERAPSASAVWSSYPYPRVGHIRFVDRGVMWVAFELVNTGSLGVTVRSLSKAPPTTTMARVDAYMSPKYDEERFVFGPDGPERVVSFRPFKLEPGRSRLVALAYRFRDCGWTREPSVEEAGVYATKTHRVRFRFLVMLSRAQDVELPVAVALEAGDYCPRTDKARRAASMTLVELQRSQWEGRIRKVSARGYPDISLTVYTDLRDDERSLAQEIAKRAGRYVASGTWKVLGSSGQALSGGGSHVQAD